MGKQRISGIVSNVSTNPFQTFSSKRTRDSKLLSFDINFDICDEDGRVIRVWFNRSFRFPPPLEDGDYLEIYGRFGQFFGLIGRKNFYALRIIDRNRKKEYTSWRTRELGSTSTRSGGDDLRTNETG